MENTWKNCWKNFISYKKGRLCIRSLVKIFFGVLQEFSQIFLFLNFMRNYKLTKIIKENLKSDRKNLRNFEKKYYKENPEKFLVRASVKSLLIDISKSVQILTKLQETSQVFWKNFRKFFKKFKKIFPYEKIGKKSISYLLSVTKRTKYA